MVLLNWLRENAWVTSKGFNEKHPSPEKRTIGWTFTAPCVGWDSHGVYKFIVHTPIYFMMAISVFLLFISRVLLMLYERLILGYKTRRGGRDVTDSSLFDLVTRTTLVIMCEIITDEVTGVEYLSLNLGKFPKVFFFEYPNVKDPLSLRVRWNLQTKRLVSAETDFDGNIVRYGDLCSRNEIILGILVHYLAVVLHPRAHVACERSALEIENKRIKELDLSMYFVRPLHEGLIHGPLSPESKTSWNPLKIAESETIEDLVSRAYEFPHTKHLLDNKKRQFPVYRFFEQGRKTVRDLAMSMDIQVDIEDLFLNVVVHGIDHQGVYDVMKDLPLVSRDLTGHWSSYWGSFLYIHFWVPHPHNPFHSEFIKDHKDRPFYGALYQKLHDVDPYLADHMVASCSF